MIMVLRLPDVLINAKVAGPKLCTIVTYRLHKHIPPRSALIIFRQKQVLYKMNMALPNTHGCLLSSNQYFLSAMAMQALNEDFLLISS